MVHQTSSDMKLAHRAVMGRFLATLLNEGLIQGFVEGGRVTIPLGATSIWFPVDPQRAPLLEENQVRMLDPDDIVFPVLESEKEMEDIGSLSRLVGRHLGQDMTAVLKEMDSSVENLGHEYENIKPLPSLADGAMEWEQSLVEGHPTHPMNRARSTNPPMNPILPTDDLTCPSIRLFSLAKEKVTVCGAYLDHVLPLMKGIPNFDGENSVAIPVHERQVPMVSHHFPDAIDLGVSFPARAQASVRTVRLDLLPHLNFKLALAATITSALRTITPWTTHLGPGFNPVADAVIEDKDILKVAYEVGSAIAVHSDPDVQKHLSCIIRTDAEASCPGESVVVCAALTEKRHGKYILPDLLGLGSVSDRLAFLETYASILLKGLLTPIIKHGLAFEAHLQNTLARFDKHGKLTGFCIRDFGGIKVHTPTLRDSTGLELDVWNDEACQLAHSLQDVYHVAYHTLVQMHLHRIVRALDLHYSRQGWQLINNLFHHLLPQNHPAREYFLNTRTAPWKAFLSMKFDGLYRDYLYSPVPNLLLLKPTNSISPTVSR